MAKLRVSYLTRVGRDGRGAVVVLAVVLAAMTLLSAASLAASLGGNHHPLSVTDRISARPELAVSPNGNYATMVCTEGHEAGADLGHVYLYVFSFGKWGSAIPVFSSSASECAYQAAVAATNSQAHVVYVSFDNCSSSGGAHVHYATCSLPSGPCTDESDVVSVDAPVRILWTDLALDADGNPHVVWSQYASETADGQIKYRAYNGSVWGGIEPVYTGVGDSRKPAIAWANNYAHVVWQEGEVDHEASDQNKTKIRYSRSSGSGWSGWGLGYLGEDYSSPDVAAWEDRAAAGKDKVFVVWEQCVDYDSNGYCEVYNLAYRRSNDNGANWLAIREVGTDYEIFTEEYISIDSEFAKANRSFPYYWQFLQPSIALNDDGWPAVVWHADCNPLLGEDGDDYKVYYTYATSGTEDSVSWIITPTLLDETFHYWGHAVVGVVGKPGDMQLHVVEMQTYGGSSEPSWDIWYDYFDWYEGEGSRWKHIYLPLVFKGQ